MFVRSWCIEAAFALNYRAMESCVSLSTDKLGSVRLPIGRLAVCDHRNHGAPVLLLVSQRARYAQTSITFAFAECSIESPYGCRERSLLPNVAVSPRGVSQSTINRRAFQSLLGTAFPITRLNVTTLLLLLSTVHLKSRLYQLLLLRKAPPLALRP